MASLDLTFSCVVIDRISGNAKSSQSSAKKIVMAKHSSDSLDLIFSCVVIDRISGNSKSSQSSARDASCSS